MIHYKRYLFIYAVTLHITGLLSFVAVARAQTADSATQKWTAAESTVANGALPRLIADSFVFTEGPASDASGNVFFTDQPKNRIWKYGADGSLSIFMENAGRSNGLYVDRQGNLVACADEHNQLWSISPSRKVTILVKDVSGLHLNGPNDLWISPNGSIYFTDPYYQRDYWNRKAPEIKDQRVYLLQKNKPLKAVVDTLRKPNGIIGTPDGRYLFVADIEAGKTYKYKITADGSLKDPELFTNMGSDGMTIDNQGNVYLTGNGVTVFNASGKQIGHIPVAAQWTSNVTFGGRNWNQLFITASQSIYVVDMKVRGAGH